MQAAWAATRTKNTYLSDKYRKLVPRRGKKKALIAIARKILVMVYYVLKNQVPYQELGHDYLDELDKGKRLKYYRKRLKEMGFEIELKPAV